MLRIFYLAPFDCSDSTGHAAHARAVVHALAHQGHLIHLFAAGWRPEPGSSIHYIHVPQARNPGFYSLSYTLACIPRLCWWLVQARPDIGYTRFFNTLPFLAILFRLFRVPLVVELNADQAAEHVAYGRSRMRRSSWDASERTVYRHAAGMVSVAPGIVASLRRRFPQVKTPITVIENGVDINEFYPLERSECKSMLGLDATTRYIVYVGAFQPWQGLDTLLAAAPGIIAEVPDVVFILAGGSASAMLELNARIDALGMKKHFILPGIVVPRLAARYIGASELCVAPYNQLAADCTCPTQESPLHMNRSPLKILTYLACGRSVVAADYQEAGLFVQEIGAGRAFTRGDALALQQAIVLLLQQPDIAEGMGQAGAAYVRRHRSWQAVAARIVEFLEQLLDDRRAQAV